MGTTAVEAAEKRQDSGHMAAAGLLWVVVLLLGGLFVVDAIGALETEPDECYAYAYGSGPGGYGCNPLLDDAYFEVDQTDDLVDRQTVHIDGFLFDAHAQIGIVQCSGVSFVLEDTPSGVDACDLSTVVLGSTDGDGSFGVDMRVRRIIHTPDAGEVDCAEPDAACVVAGGVIGSDGMSTTEAAYASITFDPTVPPAPAPTVNVEVLEIDADSATLVVHCPNAIGVSIEVQVQQEIDGLYGSAYGYLSSHDDTAPECAGGPTEVQLALEAGSRRIGRGDATYHVFAHAYDGFDSATTSVEGELRVRRTPRPSSVESNDPGADIRLELLGISGHGEGQKARLTVHCDRPLTGDDPGHYRNVGVQVSQWAGLDRIIAHGNVELGECDGATVVAVPLRASNGRLQGGKAQLHASVSVQSYDENTGEYYFDHAALAAEVRLRGRLAADLQEVGENPDSRITIDSVTRAGVAGTIECEESVVVDLQLSARQYQGRVIRDGYAYVSGLECDGLLDFDVEWNTPLSQGTTAVVAYGNGYTVEDDYEPPSYPTVTTTTTTMGPTPTSTMPAGAAMTTDPDPSFAMARSIDAAAVADGHITYVWFDQQGTTVRVRR